MGIIRNQPIKIVIFLQNRNFFGAQIAHIPLLENLRINYPDSKIYIVTKHSVSNILKELYLADEIIFEKGRSSLFTTYLNINPDISINLRRNSTFINLLVSLFNANMKIGFETFITKPFFTSQKKHLTEVYRAENYLNLINGKLCSEIHNINDEIILLPGAGGKHKIWDLGNYLKLAHELQLEYTNHKISFVLGKAEADLVEKTKPFHCHYNLPIHELVNKIKRSKLIIGNDCGPSHIAHIYNKPRIILFSNEFNDADKVIKEWFRPTKNSIALVGEVNQSINSILYNSVFQAAFKLLNTS